MFNPYSSAHYTQLIGNVLDSEEQNNELFNEASEILINCQYKQPNLSNMPKQNELSILSLNVQSLSNKIVDLRENIGLYEKFDVLLFNETNCKFDKLAHGISDIAPDGFHDPILQNPIRTSGKGGGLVAYVHKRVCEEENIELFEPCGEPNQGYGEFQFLKIMIICPELCTTGTTKYTFSCNSR